MSAWRVNQEACDKSAEIPKQVVGVQYDPAFARLCATIRARRPS